MILRPGNAQWMGARAEQQDAFGFAGCDAEGGSEPRGVLVVLADGMGGLEQGGAASRLAVSVFLAEFAAAPADLPPPEALAQALAAANGAVHALARETAGEGAVGTTLVAAAVRDGALCWIAAGDSRLYLYRAEDGSLTACTEDHTLATALQARADDGGLTPAAVADHPDRDALTSFLGLPEPPLVDASRRPLALRPRDRLLLCSDGVDRVLSAEALAAPLAGAPQTAAEALIAAVRAAGLVRQDNATVAILACDPPAPAAAAAPTGRAGRWRWPSFRRWRCAP